MSCVVEDGIIYSETCELNVVHHCNLSCRGCSHLSPVSKKHYMNPAKALEDLSILAKYYRAEHVRLLGGEPLLHRNLLDVVDAARRSGISNRVHISTNGVLLWKMTDDFWRAVDEVHVSMYPSQEMTTDQLEWCQHKAQLHNVDLKLLYFDRFRESYSELGTYDELLVQRIYNTCMIAHQWHCYNVQGGYFYKCPQSLFIPKVLDDALRPPTVDGIKIVDSPTFGRDLLAYLESSRPLSSCYYCLGSVGRLFPSEQVSRRTWRELQQHATEELVDWAYLTILEDVEPDADNLCQHSHILDPLNQDLISKCGLSDVVLRHWGKDENAITNCPRT